MQVISSPVIGKLVNRTGPRIIIVGGLVIEVLSTVVYALSGSNFAMALAARSIQGVASSCIMVGGQSFIARVASGNEGSLGVR